MLIRERMVAGDSDNEVLNFISTRYGDNVLLEPRWSAKNTLCG